LAGWLSIQACQGWQNLLEGQAMIDPSDHMGIIGVAINKLDVPMYIRDEAYSEGLVALTRAASSFDPQRGAQLSTWLMIKVGYALQDWLENHRKHQSLSIEACGIDCPVTDQTESCIFFHQVLDTAEVCLSRREQVVVFGPAWGMKSTEITSCLARNAKQIREMKDQAREKLRNQLGLI